jgi:hypothetical protein
MVVSGGENQALSAVSSNPTTDIWPGIAIPFFRAGAHHPSAI